MRWWRKRSTRIVSKFDPPKPTEAICTSRWWNVDPSMRCQRPADGHATHVWSDPGTGRGDDRTYHWTELP